MKAVKERTVVLLPKWEALARYRNMHIMVRVCFVMSLVVLLIYPVLAPVPAVFAFMYYISVYAPEFASEEKLTYYKKMFTPKVVPKHLVSIGYEVYGNELQNHLNIVTSNDFKTLSAVQQRMKKNPYRQVGFDSGFLKEHIWAIGKTGSGKTSMAVTLIQEAMKASAGVVYVDGKGELKNAHWLYTLATQLGREHEFFVVNYREPSKSNKFNPLEGLGPEALSEFFFSLLPAPSGDQEYWQGRGKTLFRPVAYFYYMRQKYWDETFTFETLSTSLDKINFSCMCAITFALIQSLEDRLNSDARVKPIIDEARTLKLPQSPYEAVELLTSYFMQMPYKAEAFEKMGYNRHLLSLLYRTYSLVDNYTSSVAAKWKTALMDIGKCMIKEASAEGDDIMSLDMVSLRSLYRRVMDRLEDVAKSKGEAYGFDARKAADIVRSANLEGDDLGGDPIQHQYAQQQWDNLMSVFTSYEEIFKPVVPDFNLMNVIRNGQIVFFVFPAMDKSESTMRTLAKVIVRVLSNAISESLGKDFEITQTQRKIIESIAKPKPLALVMFDEYGSYSVEGVETIAAQARSLNYSLVILTQDYTSARPGEGREQPAARLWANTSKLIFGVMDSEAIKKVSETLVRTQRVVSSGFVEGEGSVVMDDPTLRMDSGLPIQPEKLVNFANGFAILITKTEDEPIFVQCYYSPQVEHEKGYEFEYKLTKLRAV